MADRWDLTAGEAAEGAFSRAPGAGFGPEEDYGDGRSPVPDGDTPPDWDDYFLDDILREYGGGRRQTARPPLEPDIYGDADAGADAYEDEDWDADENTDWDGDDEPDFPEEPAPEPRWEKDEPEPEDSAPVIGAGEDDTYVSPEPPEEEPETPPADEPLPDDGPDGPDALDGSDESDGSDVPDTPDDFDGSDESGAPDGPDAFDATDGPSPAYDRRQFTGSDASGEKRGFAERFLTPVIRLIATAIAKRQMQYTEAANWPDPVEIRETPELPPRKAAKYYARLAGSNRFRCRLATLLCLFLAWISLGLPAAGMLGQSLALRSGVCLILTLAVMMAALDVVSAGLRQLAEFHPGTEALAALAAVLSCLDAALVLAGHGDSLPFCAVGALALTSALWGQRLRCSALTRTLKTAAEAKAPAVLTPEPDGGKGSRGLLRCQRPSLDGVVRRSEEPDLCQTVYAVAAPVMLAVSLALTIIACIGGNWSRFLHILSALVAAGASFAAFFSFSLPYALAARKLRAGGAAVAGYAGCAEIGKTRRIVVGDGDLFPPGAMEFTEINVLEGTPIKQVVSCTASLIDASGSGVAPLFDELMARRKYTMPQVYEFRCHEGGGLSGLVDGQRVLVGPAGYMNLMGIRLPNGIQSRNAICTAIGNELVGVFIIEYKPVTAVQEALVTLMKGRTHVTFATRDFSITPLMIKRLFHISADNFNFPTFRERYRLAAAAAREDAPIDALMTRPGLLPFAEAAETGRKLYSTCFINTVLSVLGSAIGIAVLFILFRAGSFDTACVRNVLLFMLLWALPEVILSVGQNR